MNGIINPNNLPTTYTFLPADPVGTEKRWLSSPAMRAIYGNSTVNVSYRLIGLNEDTEYSYILRAENSAGQTSGDKVTFRTHINGPITGPFGEIMRRARIEGERVTNSAWAASPLFNPISGESIPDPYDPKETVTEDVGSGCILVVAYVCARTPKAPDPDTSITW